MRRLLILIILMLPVPGVCQPQLDLSPSPDESWYQVEVILFADSRFDSSSEAWAPVDAYYPANLVAIGKRGAGGPAPESLWQLADVQQYSALLQGGAADGARALADDEPELLFEAYSRSRRKVDSPIRGEDLIVGLTLDSREESADSTPSDASSGAAGDTADATGQSEIAPAVPAIPLDELLAEHGPIPYVAVDAQTRRLTDLRTRLRRSRNYRVLYHEAWVQPITGSEHALPILIQGGERFDDLYELDGTITLSRSRYLHIDARLWFTLFEQAARGQAVRPPALRELPMSEVELARSYPELAQYESNRGSRVPGLTVELLQSRRMRSEQLHYIDHPAFGLIIEITPIASDEEFDSLR